MLTYGNGFSHSRITQERFYALNQAFQQEVIALDQPLGGRVQTPEGRSIVAYPNPSTGQLRIRLPNQQLQADLLVFSQLGTLVHTHSGFSSFDVLDLTPLPAGLYYVQATYAGSSSIVTIAIIILCPAG